MVAGDYDARRVTEELNKFGYAVYAEEAPSPALRAHLHLLQNWPVFLVTTDVFSGNTLYRMNAALVIQHKPDADALTALEYQMAFSYCSLSAVITPPTERGLFALASAYSVFKLGVPIRL